MVPVELRITNFRSFRGTQSFRFPRGPGLFFMYGENRAEPRLGANGSGKSSVWEALTWVCFGKTSRGLKAGDAANWEAEKDCRVELDYEVTDDQHDGAWMLYTLTRTWKPITWKLTNAFGDSWDLTKDDSNIFTSHLRLGFEPWLHSIVMAQTEPMFLDLKPTEQAALFSEVMGLNRWIEYAEKAGKLATETDREVRRLEREAANIGGRLEQLLRTSVQEQITKWKAEHTATLIEIEKDYENVSRRLAPAKQQELDLRQAEAVARQRLNHLTSHQQAGARKCPECGQALPSTERTRELLQAQDDVADAAVRARQALNEITRLEHELERLDQEHDHHSRTENPYTQLQAQQDRERRELLDDKRWVTERLDDLQGRYNLLQMWVRWFKEIRLAQIGDALRELEVEVNSCCNELGLVGWELLFDIDRETKKGSIQRGFSATVRSPHNERPVPWEAWSGGESQRLRVAGQQGLADLIRARSQTPFDLEVWDEPTQWMSEEGVLDLLNSLEERAKRQRRQIWIVDHRSLGYGGFNGTVGVIKTQEGSIFRHHAV